MNAKALALSALVCAVLVVVGHELFALTWESALVLAPVFVVLAGGMAFLVVLWAKVIYESLKRRSSAARSESSSDAVL